MIGARREERPLSAGTPSSVSPGRHARIACVLAVTVLAAAVARAGDRAEAGPPKETPTTLFERYEVLRKRDDFNSFTERMDTIRRLGRHPGPEACRLLLHVVARSRSLDDKVVATLTLGPLLDGESIRKLADVVKRPKDEALAVALAQAFGLATEPDALAWLAGEALSSRYAAVREAALHAQYIHADPAARASIMEAQDAWGEKSGGVAVQFGAVRALGSIGGPEVRQRLLAACEHEDWRVRLAAADVIARQKPLVTVVRAALKALLDDPEPGVQRAAAQAIGRARQDEMVPELAALLEAPLLRTRAVAHEALNELSGKDLGFLPADWIEWWRHRDGNIEARSTPSTSVATYYGLSVYSDRLLFIIDLSGSMAFPWGDKNTRISIARDELTKVLRKLAPGSLFNVIVFSDRVKAWRKGEAQATKENVQSALDWIAKTFEKPRGGTFMHAALQKAFRENPRIDTIYLLTDGLATDGEPVVPEAILASLSAWNRYRRVVIHTVALTLETLDPNGVPERDLKEIKAFMKRVAAMTGGDSRVVTKLPKKP